MKIYIIKASAHSAFKDYKQAMGAPPQSINALAAAATEWATVKTLDETSQAAANEQESADLVVICMSTPDALRGYQLADVFRRRGIPVVLGGLHPSFMPGEAQQHADAVLCGEAEQLFPQLLNDFCQHRLKPLYKNEAPLTMQGLQPYPQRLIDLKAYGNLNSVMVSRGCKFKCEFCTVHKFFPQFNVRPVGEIVDEIKASGGQYFELHADNLIADRDYAMELFAALKPLNIYWLAEATLNIAEYPDILEAAAESGLFYLLVGLETPSQAALDAAGKKFIRISRAKDNIARLHEYKIAVDSAMIFGFDQHSEDIFEESLDFVADIQLDHCDSVILTPFPGTDLFSRYGREGRILTRDWSKYDCSHAVFRPAGMTPEQLEEGADRFARQYSSLGRSLKRRWNRHKNLGWHWETLNYQ